MAAPPEPEPDRHRPMFAVAYRILGSVHDAEDAVQEAEVRWHRLPQQAREAILNPDAWMTTVVSRICLDQLTSARVRRERYLGVWLPEPVLGRVDRPGVGTDPAEVAELAESVSMAMLVVMEQLSPAERVAFVLHDLFGVPFDEVAETLQRTPAAARQLATSARRHLRGQARYDCAGPDRDRVVEAFSRASTEGDLQGLLDVLGPEVVLRSDTGGQVSAATRPVVGADRVARFLLGILGQRSPSWVAEYGQEPAVISIGLVNGQNGLVVHLADRLAAVVALGVAAGRIETIDLVANPAKLVTEDHRGDHGQPGD